MRKIARRLIIRETSGKKLSGPGPLPGFLVCAQLRSPLSTLMGSAGYRALLSRALALAGAEIAWLRSLQVKADGTLPGPKELTEKISPKDMAEGQIVLVAHLLGLLVAFIGEKLTLQLIREIWPKLSLNDLPFGQGTK